MSLPRVCLILTVIGDDRPGLVGELSAAISAQGGNWLRSSLAQLGGKFAGIVEVEVGAARVDTLRTSLAALNGLKVSTEAAHAGTPAPAARRLKLALVGHDRIGIVREVTQVLAGHAVNVESLETRTSSAPMSAAMLFHATAELTAAPGLDAPALTQALEQISQDLMVDITLDETIRP